MESLMTETSRSNAENATNHANTNSCDDDIVESFEDLNLNRDLLRGIFSYGYEKPSAIQQKAIKPGIQGRDIVGQAQSGTGKTATFSITLLQRINVASNTTQGLILAPTRELANQIYSVIKELGRYMNVQCHACVGGRQTAIDLDRLRQGVHVVVGTPGRVLHMMENRILTTDDLKVFVLDEADQMLSHEFTEQIQNVYRHLPDSTQILLFSATMPPPILEVTKNLMRDPVHILVEKEELTLEGINQFFVNVEQDDHKLPTMIDLYTILNVTQSVVFVNTVVRSNDLYEKLLAEGFTISRINRGMSQAERDAVMKQYRSGESRILLSTDVLARGIDVQQVSCVVNYDLPHNRETYIHRIGRSGRFGRKGTAINFITRDEIPLLKELENYYHTTILEMPEDIADYV